MIDIEKYKEAPGFKDIEEQNAQAAQWLLVKITKIQYNFSAVSYTFHIVIFGLIANLWWFIILDRESVAKNDFPAHLLAIVLTLVSTVYIIIKLVQSYRKYKSATAIKQKYLNAYEEEYGEYHPNMRF